MKKTYLVRSACSIIVRAESPDEAVRQAYDLARRGERAMSDGVTVAGAAIEPHTVEAKYIPPSVVDEAVYLQGTARADATPSRRERAELEAKCAG